MAKRSVEPEIAARIRTAILSKGEKLAVFSRESGMPYPSLMDYYNGTRKPGFDALATLIGYTGVSAEWLLHGKGSMKAKTIPIQETILGHIIQILAYAQSRLIEGQWTVQDGDPDKYLYAIEDQDLKSHLNDVGELAAMAASIYNRIAHIANDTDREEAIRGEVLQMLRLKHSLTANHLPSSSPSPKGKP